MSQPPTPTNGTPGVVPHRRPAPSPAHQHGHLSHAHSHPHSHGSHILRTGHIHSHNHMHTELDSASLSSGRFDIDWEAKERELEEARARAAQMEKTMRWWSDCTANWREKWSKVRTERNKAREEAKLLRTKLEVALKDCSAIRRDKQSMENENEFLRAEIERLQHDHPHSGNLYSSETPTQEPKMVDKTSSRQGTPEVQLLDEVVEKCSSPVKSEESVSPLSALSPRARLSPNAVINSSASNKDVNGFESEGNFGAIPKLRNSSSSREYDVEERTGIFTDGRTSRPRRSSSQEFPYSKDNVSGIGRLRERHGVTSDPLKFLESLDAPDVEFLQQKLTHVQLRLDEATKTIQAEREEKTNLHRAMETLQMELLELRSRVDELKRGKQDAERQLLAAQDQHRQQLMSLQQDRRDDANTRETLDRRLADLRSELERLQAENAAEWGRRERVETERQALERENKKLKAALTDLQERLEKRNTAARGLVSSPGSGASAVGGDLENKQIHAELEEKNKELLELRHAHNKLKKALQDKSVELSHGLRRAEHSEAEVRRLRTRIDELKREVATAQDELDAATNHVRKLQRSNEEFQEQVESLQMQITHLQTRLRSSNGSSFLTHRESLLQDTLSEDDGNEY